MPDDLQPPPTAAAAKSATSTGARVILIIAVVAVIARLLLAVLSHSTHVSKTSRIATWPPKAGDTFTLKPGDPAIAKWADSPDNDGFLVQLTDANGQPIADAQGSVGNRICALMPDYMAAADQPGGTLTLVTQEGTGDWRLHWQGGETMPPVEAPTDSEDIVHRNASCGKDAYLTMSQAQLHSWFNMQSGIPEPPKQ